MGLQFKTKWAHRVQAALRRRPAPAAVALPALAAVPVNAEWDEAFLRLESYLRAYQIESRVLLNRLATEIITAARTLAAEHPHEAPVTLAIQVAHARIGEWLVHALGGGDWADERFRARGRLATLMAEIPQSCPEYFLALDDLPPSARARLATAQLVVGPDVRLTSMPSAPLEFPLADAMTEKWVTFSRSTFLRAATSWIVIAGVVSVAWFATR